MTLLVISCSRNKVPKQNPVLLNWTSEFVMDDGEQANGYYHNHENFIKPYFSAVYKTDTLTTTTLREVNCCGKTVGEIKMAGDTIYLFTRHTSDVACTCVEFRKYTYVIHNPENKEFMIKSEPD